MTSNAINAGRTVVPTLRYRDVAAAIDWLCNAFGFARHHVVTGKDGSVQYAELTFGDGMIMLAPVEGSAFDRLMAQPEDTGGAETQICYLFVADAGAHCAHARAAGAEIVLDIEDVDSNGRGYSCRDPEGHIWSFGTYNPWKHEAGEPVRSYRDTARNVVRHVTLVAALLVMVIVSAVVGGWALGVVEEDPGEVDAMAAIGLSHDAGSKPALSHEGTAQEAIERAVREASDQLARERTAKDAAERTARLAREQLTQERGAKEAAEAAAREAREQLARERVAKETAERGAKEAREQLIQERNAKAAKVQAGEEVPGRLSLAERAAQDAQEQLAEERRARLAAEQAAKEVREQLAKERSAKESAERTIKERAARKPPRYRQAYPKPPSSQPFIWQ